MSGIITQNVLDSSGLIKAVAAGGTWVEIKSLTASADSTLSFVNGTSDVVLDSTYPIYCFEFINIHPSNDGVNFQVNLSADTGSNYNVTKSTSMWLGNHAEGDSYAAISYLSSMDLAQSTAVQPLTENTGSDADQSCSGYFYLFGPSSTTFVKHFLAWIHNCRHGDAAELYSTQGYGNTTSAVDAIQFSFSAGNIDLGKIKLFGIKDS